MSIKVYEVINNRIIKLLEQGTIPWKKPWNAESNMPKNLISKKHYRGINMFLLNCLPYSSPYFLTFKQVQDKDGQRWPRLVGQVGGKNKVDCRLLSCRQ
jgi:antirestriction protein ArdC